MLPSPTVLTATHSELALHEGGDREGDRGEETDDSKPGETHDVGRCFHRGMKGDTECVYCMLVSPYQDFRLI